MTKLTIDGQPVEVSQGTTLLEAASKLGIEIPMMCFLEGCEPSTSCMVCVVKVHGRHALVPACATVAEEGMVVEASSQEIIEARKTALELLLSDHVGDCMGPCQLTCPAHMDIPLMIRQIASGQLAEAIETVKKDIALPAVLGRICPGPCENACRRSKADHTISICLLKRHVADVDLQSSQPYQPMLKPKAGKKVAIVGAGPAGLAAAYYLLIEGIDCTIYDEHEQMGGELRYAIDEHDLPRDILDAEIATIQRLGFEFKANTNVGVDITFDDLRKQYDAVFIAIGQLKKDVEMSGLKTSDNGILTDSIVYSTSIDGVFAGGDAVRKRKLAIRAVADGKEAANSISQYLRDEKVTGPARPFNTRMGKLLDGEMEMFLETASGKGRVKPTVASLGYSVEQAKAEAERCLHCDCRKADDCKLRLYSKQYSASSTQYKAQRRMFEQQNEHPDIIYESGKCIDCGLCVQIAEQYKESLGLAFIGRGFNVRVATPFSKSIAEGLKITAQKCAKACPTGAIAIKNDRL